MTNTLIEQLGSDESRSWMVKAQCRDLPTEIFHPDEEAFDYEERVADAVMICNTCVVQTECFEWALLMDERIGVWGGCTPEERTRIANRRKKAKRKRAS